MDARAKQRPLFRFLLKAALFRLRFLPLKLKSQFGFHLFRADSERFHPAVEMAAVNAHQFGGA